MSDTTASLVRDKIRKLLKHRPGISCGQIQLDTAFTDLGFDSLDRVSLLFEIECAFDLEISDVTVTSMETVGDLVTYLEDKQVHQP